MYAVLRHKFAVAKTEVLIFIYLSKITRIHTLPRSALGSVM